MQRWKQLQDWITANNLLNGDFTARQLAADLGIATWEATWLIQAHLVAQRGSWATTTYVLTRHGRTRAAVWHVGIRTSDARNLCFQAADDVRVHLEPVISDLNRIGTLNPRALPLIQVAVTAINFSTAQFENQLQQLLVNSNNTAASTGPPTK